MLLARRAGLLCVASGDARLAAQLFGAMENLRAEVGASIIAGMAPALAHGTASVRAALGPSRFETEFKAGQQLRRDAAARLALREAAPQAVAASEHRRAGGLGQREADVARLVADGLSNKEIGVRLFISERTVESHVRNILNKLGFNSRPRSPVGWGHRIASALPMAWSRRPPSPPEQNALELELQVAAGVTQGDQPVVAEEVELSLLAASRSPRRTASRTWKG